MPSYDNGPPGYTHNPQEFVSSLKVDYSDDQPAGSIREINGQSADINKGFDGEYVWVIPQRASRPSEMVDTIWVDIASEKDPSRNDIAAGAGGDYRYFQWSRNMNVDRFITDIALWRSDDDQSTPPSGWDGMSSDINRSRSGDYLYLVWRTKAYSGPKNA
ncbi:hypothetical protein EDB80DRAFT_815995, partial [Ilyonectria destructans]